MSENDTGPDDANHSQHGIFVIAGNDARAKGGRHLKDVHIMDIAPTVLDILGLGVPVDMQGKVIG